MKESDITKKVHKLEKQLESLEIRYTIKFWKTIKR